MSDRPIIVAGGIGFIGSHLCDALITRGEEVWAVDNFATGRRANVAHLIAHPRFRLTEADVTGPLPAAIPPAHHLYHLASPASPNAASPRSYLKLPLATALVNTVGTQLLLERGETGRGSSSPRPAKSTAIPPCIRNRRAIAAIAARPGRARSTTRRSGSARRWRHSTGASSASTRASSASSTPTANG